MFKHNQGERNPKRVELLSTAHTRYQDDGLNSIRLRILDVKLYSLFTHILVDVGKPIVPTDPPESSITPTSTQPTTTETSKQSILPSSGDEEMLVVKLLSEKLTTQRNFTKNELEKLRELLSLLKS